MNDEAAKVPAAAALRAAVPATLTPTIDHSGCRGCQRGPPARASAHLTSTCNFFSPSRAPEGYQKSSTNDDIGDAPSTQRRSARAVALATPTPTENLCGCRGCRRGAPARVSAHLTSICDLSRHPRRLKDVRNRQRTTISTTHLQRSGAPRRPSPRPQPSSSLAHRRGGQRELPARTSARLTSVSHFFGLRERSEIAGE